MNESAPTTRPVPRRWIAVALAAGLLCGCRTIRTPLDGMLGKKNDDASFLASAHGVRDLLPWKKRTTSLDPAAGRDEFEAAQKLFDEKKYKQAEKAADKVADKYKGSPVREDALFLVAEAQFAQKRYSWAQDSYDLLVKEFPSTRYLERRNKRLFTIARIWLNDPSYATSDNIKLTGFHPDGQRFQATATTKPKRGFDLSRSVPIFPNLWDRTRPVFDTDGRALQALKSIWLHDPNGALADDALMLTASHYLRTGNYEEADHIYSILRDEYPKSPHAEAAHVLGSFVKHASYQGPEYDSTVLDAAKDLKVRTLRLYPSTAEKARIRKDIRQIELAKAATLWADVRFYQRKDLPKSVRVCCEDLIESYPDSPYADKARKVLEEMGAPVPRRRVRRREPEPEPNGPEPRRFREPKVASPAVKRDSRADPPARVRL